jgi:hypothetical protein
MSYTPHTEGDKNQMLDARAASKIYSAIFQKNFVQRPKSICPTASVN